MPWTKADRAIIVEAIRDTIAGKRVSSVTTADRQETYYNPTIQDLKKFLDQIDAIGSNRPRILRSRYSKGL